MLKKKTGPGDVALCFAAAIAGLGGIGFSVKAQNLTFGQTFTYIGPQLPLTWSAAPYGGTCPPTAGSITATTTYENIAPGDYWTGVVSVLSSSFPFPPTGGLESASVLVSNGQVYEGFIGSPITYVGSPSPDYIYYATSAFNAPTQNNVSHDNLLITTPNELSCQYSSNTPGIWSGPMLWGSPKTLGHTSAPADPANLPSSPTNPTPTNANANNGCTSSNPTDPMPSCDFGNPINAATGNKVQTETDFTGAVSTSLSLVRTYNSQDGTASHFGARWRDEWHRVLGILTGNSVTVTRADGRQDVFTKNGTVYTADPDVTSTLKAVFSGSTITGYQLTTAADVTETYSATGQLLTITSRAGLVTKLAYNASNQLTTVTGPFGHVMSFTYNAGGQVASMTAPDGGVYAYAYDAHLNLISVTYPDKTVRQYDYEVTAFPNLLTGIIDENSVRYATWTYDSVARATSSQHAGVELNTVAYTSSTGAVANFRDLRNLEGFRRKRSGELWSEP